MSQELRAPGSWPSSVHRPGAGGVDDELLLSNQYGHQLHVWDLRRRRHQQAIDLGAIAFFVYERVGLQILRRAWLNTDQLWAGAFVLAGLVTLTI